MHHDDARCARAHLFGSADPVDFPARCARAHILLVSKIYTCSPVRSALFEYFAYFVVSKSTCRAFVSIRQIRGFFSRMLRVFRG